MERRWRRNPTLCVMDTLLVMVSREMVFLRARHVGREYRWMEKRVSS